jgi:hypothetical protein
MDENQREPDVEYRLGVRVLPDLVFMGVVILWAALNNRLLIAWVCTLHKLCVNPGLSYTTEYIDPWLTFYSGAVSVIFILVSSGFFLFLGAC